MLETNKGLVSLLNCAENLHFLNIYKLSIKQIKYVVMYQYQFPCIIIRP